MIFEYLKSQYLIIWRRKRAFEVKWKTFFPGSQVLSFRHTKQSSKKVADTSFKDVVEATHQHFKPWQVLKETTEPADPFGTMPFSDWVPGFCPQKCCKNIFFKPITCYVTVDCIFYLHFKSEVLWKSKCSNKTKNDMPLMKYGKIIR